jgi:hypothetical protein
MALGGINAGLNTSVPSGSSQAGPGQQDLRSIKTTFQEVLDSEHHFPNTGGAGSGAHRLGSARAFYGAASALSSSDTDGRLYIDSTNSRLHHAGSSNTILLGGRYATLAYPVLRWMSPFLVSSADTPSVDEHWALETGMGIMPKGSLSTILQLRTTFLHAVPTITPASTNEDSSTVTQRPLPALSSGPIVGATVTIVNTDTSGVVSSAGTYRFCYFVMGIAAL